MARPRKNIPIYYTHPVLLDDKTYEKIRWAKLPNEPLGSVVQRLIAQSSKETIILNTNART